MRPLEPGRQWASGSPRRGAPAHVAVIIMIIVTTTTTTTTTTTIIITIISITITIISIIIIRMRGCCTTAEIVLVKREGGYCRLRIYCRLELLDRELFV